MKKMKETTKGRLLIVSTALLWGLAGVCVKSIPWSAVSIMAARCFLCVLILLLDRRTLRMRLNRRTVFGAAMASLTGILYMFSIKLTTAATAIVLQYTAPVLVFLYTVVAEKRRPRPREALIVLTVFAGCVLSFADGLEPRSVLGNLLGLASGVTFAAQIVAFGDPGADADSGMLLSNLAGFALCLPFCFFDPALTFTGKTVFWVLVMGIFQYGLANLCYAKGCRRLEKTETSLLLTIEPIFNPIPVWLVTGEIPGPTAIAGFFVVIAGVTAFVLTTGRRAAEAAAPQ